jgi:hypothetical protein
MISLAAYKQILGDEAQGMTDAEIEQIRDAQYQLAEIIFPMWSKDKQLPTRPAFRSKFTESL